MKTCNNMQVRKNDTQSLLIQACSEDCFRILGKFFSTGILSSFQINFKLFNWCLQLSEVQWSTGNRVIQNSNSGFYAHLLNKKKSNFLSKILRFQTIENHSETRQKFSASNAMRLQLSCCGIWHAVSKHDSFKNICYNHELMVCTRIFSQKSV